MAIIELTDKNFEDQVLRSGKPVLVDFWAEWCGPCRLLEPIIEEIEGEEEIGGKVKMGKLNVDKNPDISSKYGVMSIPTLIFFKGGREVKRMVGVRGKEEIIKFLISN